MDGRRRTRLNSRLSVDHAISIYRAVLRGGRSDPLDALILSRVAAANLAHDRASPVSRNAVARSLGLSEEMAGRRTQKLIDAGSLIETAGGLTVANRTLNPEVVLAMARQNAPLLRRTVRLMREADGKI